MKILDRFWQLGHPSAQNESKVGVVGWATDQDFDGLVFVRYLKKRGYEHLGMDRSVRAKLFVDRVGVL